MAEKNDIFTFQHNDKTFALPSINKIKAGVLRKIRRLDPIDQMFTLLEAVADEETLAVLDDMDTEEFSEFGVKWQEASGVSLPE